MADLTLADVQAAIADLKVHVQTEAGQVKDKLDADAAAIKALQDQIANGTAVSQEQLQALIDSTTDTRNQVDNIVPPGAADARIGGDAQPTT